MRIVQQHQQHVCLTIILAGLITPLFMPSAFLHAQSVQAGDGDERSCYGSDSLSCRSIGHNITFPFISTRSCGEKSELFLAGCGTSNMSWPGFAFAPPGVKGFASGSINLTWNADPTNLDRCTGLHPLPLSNISDYLPETINLTDFLDSSFSFSPFNIFLLFGCDNDEVLEKNSKACKSYAAKNCPQNNSPQNNSLTCFQYRPFDNKVLTMKLVASGAHCTDFLFSVSGSQNENFSDIDFWTPNLVQLNWSTATDGDGWLASNYSKCAYCQQSHGTCGYDILNQFQCFCSDNRTYATACGAPVKKSSKRGLIIGVVVAMSGTIVLVVAALFGFWRRRKDIPINNEPGNDRLWNKKPSFLTRQQDPIMTEEFTYMELMEATDSFADECKLGDGGFGAVYMGFLADHRKVAVKKLYIDTLGSMEHFTNEVKILSKLDHPNLVKLYGFCWESKKRDVLLVFEYAPHGTVFDHLHDPSKLAMPWKLRLDIACETANALHYLHNSVSPPIYHRDVKTTNILLDEGYHAKLADFGLSKLVPLHVTHISTAPQGTPGYLDPEYHECYQLTDKSDVYSFGVVLMELVSGKLAVDMSRGKGEVNLYTLAVVKIKSGLWEELVDPKLKMKKNSTTEKMVKGVIELAFGCLQAERENRPAMSIVADSLDRLRRNLMHVDEDGEEDQSSPSGRHNS